MNHPDFPKDLEFDVGGLLVKNDGSVTLTKEQEQSLVARHGRPVKEAFSNNEFLKISGSSELPKKGIEEILVEGGDN
jgi:riboflavin biosynthesis pyrimidine reductase